MALDFTMRDIIHRITVKFVHAFLPKAKKKYNLKAVFQPELAAAALEDFAAAWDGKYPVISKSWRSRWTEIIPCLKFSPEIRKAIYTANAGKRSFPRVRLTTRFRKWLRTGNLSRMMKRP